MPPDATIALVDIDELGEAVALRREAQRLERPHLDLSDPFTGQREHLADLLESVDSPVSQAEAELDHPAIPITQFAEDRAYLPAYFGHFSSFVGWQHPLVGDDVARSQAVTERPVE